MLAALFAQLLEGYLDNVEDAEALLSVGAFEHRLDCAASELAAWTMVANTVLNMDEVISKI